MKLNHRVKSAYLLIALAAAPLSCDSTEVAQILGGKDDSAGVVDVIQDSASPGLTVRVEADQPVFTEEDGAQVKIGGQVARVLNRISNQIVEVVVPLLEPGIATVEIIEPKKNPGAPGRLNVLPVRARKVLLSLAQGQIELLGHRPTAGLARTGADEYGRRIQYEVYNKLGRLIFRDVVNHPTEGRHEIHDHDENIGHTMRQAPASTAGLFSIRIPNVPGGALVKFYDVPDNADVNTDEGRRLRSYLSELQLDG